MSHHRRVIETSLQTGQDTVCDVIDHKRVLKYLHEWVCYPSVITVIIEEIKAYYYKIEYTI